MNAYGEPLYPVPEQIERGEGWWKIPETIRIYSPKDAWMQSAGRMLGETFSSFALPLRAEPGSREQHSLSLEPADGLHVGEYRLKIVSDGISLQAGSYEAAAAGCSVLFQLLSSAPHGSGLQEQKISDAPGYQWRGAMLDSARSFYPKKAIKRYLDLMWIHRLNRFHWHLTDDQGWRLPIPELPLLTEIGAWRDDNTTNYGLTGGFYSADDIAEIVAHAADRGITVVPEIDMPGHTSAASAAYPHLNCRGRQLEVATRWGIFEDVLCAGRESTYRFVETVIRETARLFPGPYIHLGGDETPVTRWAECPECRALMRSEGMERPEELQGYFIKRAAAVTADLNRRPVVWDEVLEYDPPQDTIIASWRNTSFGKEAVKRGYEVIMAPLEKACYLDQQHLERAWEPGRLGVCTVRDTASFDPGRSDNRRGGSVLGAQGQLWTEAIPYGRLAEYMSYPRLSALADTLWGGRVRPWEEAKRRLERHRQYLRSLGVLVYPGLLEEEEET
jgi:hexosaminidase